MKKRSTLREICEKSYDVLAKSGYAPKYQDDERLEFAATVQGAKFSFYPLEDEVFGFSAEFDMGEDLSEAEQSRVEDAYLKEDEVIFENLHLGGDLVYLSSAFPCDFYPADMMESAIKTLERRDGIAQFLRSKLCIAAKA